MAGQTQSICQTGITAHPARMAGRSARLAGCHIALLHISSCVLLAAGTSIFKPCLQPSCLVERKLHTVDRT